jgi:hypothetical protein
MENSHGSIHIKPVDRSKFKPAGGFEKGNLVVVHGPSEPGLPRWIIASVVWRFSVAGMRSRRYPPTLYSLFGGFRIADIFVPDPALA